VLEPLYKIKPEEYEDDEKDDELNHTDEY